MGAGEEGRGGAEVVVDVERKGKDKKIDTEGEEIGVEGRVDVKEGVREDNSERN